jgi:hypothetical protein
VHKVLLNPGVEPYRPAAQSVQAPAPAMEYCPATHCDAVAEAEPSGHAYPAEQLPLHPADVNFGVEPYRPAGHGVHAAALSRENCPASHS